MDNYWNNNNCLENEERIEAENGVGTTQWETSEREEDSENSATTSEADSEPRR